MLAIPGAVGNLMLYIAAIAVGTIVTAIVLMLVMKPLAEVPALAR